MTKSLSSASVSGLEQNLNCYSLEGLLAGVFPDVDHVGGLPLQLLAADAALEAALLVPHHVTLQRRPRRAHLGTHLALEPVGNKVITIVVTLQTRHEQSYLTCPGSGP